MASWIVSLVGSDISHSLTIFNWLSLIIFPFFTYIISDETKSSIPTIFHHRLNIKQICHILDIKKTLVYRTSTNSLVLFPALTSTHRPLVSTTFSVCLMLPLFMPQFSIKVFSILTNFNMCYGTSIKSMLHFLCSLECSRAFSLQEKQSPLLPQSILSSCRHNTWIALQLKCQTQIYFYSSTKLPRSRTCIPIHMAELSRDSATEEAAVLSVGCTTPSFLSSCWMGAS